MKKLIAEQFDRREPLKVGDKGRPVDSLMKVIQVIDGDTFLATVYTYDGDRARPQTVMVVGMDTTNLVDQQKLECSTVFEVTGTAKYDTATSTNKVLVLKPVKGK